MAKKEEKLELNPKIKFVTMYGTENSKYHAKGEPTKVHPDMVEHFKARGLTTEEPEEEEMEDNSNSAK